LNQAKETARKMIRSFVYPVLLMALLAGGGCYSMRPSSGGGETQFVGSRHVDPADVAVPDGYEIKLVATGFTFPTGVAFDDASGVYVIEAGYSYGEVWTVPRLLRVRQGGAVEEIAHGGRNGPWTGVTWYRGDFYVAEGGQLEGGRILKIGADGQITSLLENLPGYGDHHTDGPAVGRDGKIYFGQGTATNSGVVGEDNAKFGWLKRFHRFHDIPCRDVTLTGRNFETSDVLQGSGKGSVTTGAFSSFGTSTQPGQIIKGNLPCSGAVMRIDPNGSGLELVAWGFRNPFGIAFAPDGQLYVTDNGYDDRGSRPVWGTADHLWRVTEGAWYGWPDFSGNLPLERADFTPPGEAALQALLQQHPGTPPQPAAILGVHASSNGLDFSRSASFGHVGEAFIAEFGDQSPVTGKSLHPVGFRVVRVNPKTGHVEDFAVNKGELNAPASKLGTEGLERPIAVRFSPSGDALYVVDFGVMLMDDSGSKPQQKTGALWKITRKTKGGA
jgi:glucose/arabinose dehydrogenase